MEQEENRELERTLKEDKGFRILVKLLTEIAPRWFALLGWLIILSIYIALFNSATLFYQVIFAIILSFSFLLIGIQIYALWASFLANLVRRTENTKLEYLVVIMVMVLLGGSFILAQEIPKIIAEFTFPIQE